MTQSLCNVFHPFEVYKFQDELLCIWLNGMEYAERSSWIEIWNNSKYRVATDGAVERLARRRSELKLPDVVCGDFDSIGETPQGCIEMVHRPDQSKTDLQKTIEYCISKKEKREWEFDQIVLLGGLNGRFDHTMSTLSTLVKFLDSQVFVITLDSQNLVLPIPKGNSHINVDLSMCTGKCGILPIVQSETISTSNGLKWNLDGTKMAFGEFISSSNEIDGKRVELETNNPLIFTIEIVDHI